jgi:hypothetical protein
MAGFDVLRWTFCAAVASLRCRGLTHFGTLHKWSICKPSVNSRPASSHETRCA